MTDIPPPGPGDSASREAADFVSRADAVLTRLELHDRTTRDHSDSVARWSRRLAMGLGLASAAVDFIERCALLHDVGKILTPAHILVKPAPLSGDEWTQMRAHAADGAALLSGDPVLVAYASVVEAHHERYDGSGYPHALKGDAIPFESRIVAVADSFDAMIATRCYRTPMTPSAAIDELKRCRGSHFEPAIVDCLVAIVTPRAAYRERRFNELRA